MILYGVFGFSFCNMVNCISMSAIICYSEYNCFCFYLLFREKCLQIVLNSLYQIYFIEYDIKPCQVSLIYSNCNAIVHTFSEYNNCFIDYSSAIV